MNGFASQDGSPLAPRVIVNRNAILSLHFFKSSLNCIQNVKMFAQLDLAVVATNPRVFLGTYFVDRDRDRHDD